MGQITLFEDYSLVSIFLWHITFVYLLILIFLSAVIYKNTRDKLFFHYCFYVSLLFTYIVCRNYYFIEIQNYLPVYLYTHFVQVLYLCVYFHFGLSIINFKLYHPKFTKWIYNYLIVMLLTGTLIFISSLLQWTPAYFMEAYYYKVFFPIHISIAIAIIARAFMLKQEKLRIYFLIGSISYLILGGIAVLSFFYQPFDLLLRPIGFFYLGIIIECTFFAAGLGVRVQDVYKEKLDTERKLNLAQKELQNQMQSKIEQQTQATQVALMENKILRSQMNSHFVFNVLNSIKAFIIEQNVEKAVNYLNKFSKLMRRVLDSSRDENHTLADELSAIKLYIDIEKIRIQENLFVIVDIDILQDPETIPFPSLLIQPFVENAIWHGLIPSKEEKKLHIYFTNQDNHILIEILDNGVGYLNSLTKKQKLDNHRSHGIDITRERVAQFNKKHCPKISFGIEDRTDTIGTRVWINLNMD